MIGHFFEKAFHKILPIFPLKSLQFLFGRYRQLDFEDIWKKKWKFSKLAVWQSLYWQMKHCLIML